MRAIWGDALYPNFNLRRWQLEVRCTRLLLVMDARTVFDAIQSSTTAVDRRIAVDVASLRESLGDEQNVLARWLPGPQQPADELTKHLSNQMLSALAQTCRWCLVETEEVRAAREAKIEQRREQRAAHKALLAATPFAPAISGPAESTMSI